jgi:hypothetical protein
LVKTGIPGDICYQIATKFLNQITSGPNELIVGDQLKDIFHAAVPPSAKLKAKPGRVS